MNHSLILRRDNGPFRCWYLRKTHCSWDISRNGKVQTLRVWVISDNRDAILLGFCRTFALWQAPAERWGEQFNTLTWRKLFIVMDGSISNNFNSVFMYNMAIQHLKYMHFTQKTNFHKWQASNFDILECVMIEIWNCNTAQSSRS